MAWTENHKMIKMLDLKYPLLIGDLFNFKSLKDASKLSSGFSSIIEIKELLAKLRFRNAKQSSKEGSSRFINTFYATSIKGICAILSEETAVGQFPYQKVNYDLEKESDVVHILNSARIYHPVNSILSYHLEKE